MTEPMSTPENGGRVTQRDLYDSIENLRKENKQDLKDAKEELIKVITDALAEFRVYRVDHERAHVGLDGSGTKAFQTYLTTREISEARQAGSRAVVTGAIKFANTNWKLILIALGAFASIVGTIDISTLIPK